MTATIELNDRLVNKAKKLSCITNDQDLVTMTIAHYLEGAEIRVAAIKAKEASGDKNPFWDDYDPKS
jgi:predicted transcriptional regulator